MVADSSMDVDMVDCCGEVMVGCFWEGSAGCSGEVMRTILSMYRPHPHA